MEAGVNGPAGETVSFVRAMAARETQGTVQSTRHLARPIVDGAQGASISAHEMTRLVEVLPKIKDEVLRNTVRSYFAITTKYQALNMLVAPTSRMMQEEPQVLSELLEAMTVLDRKRSGIAQKGR